MGLCRLSRNRQQARHGETETAGGSAASAGKPPAKTRLPPVHTSQPSTAPAERGLTPHLKAQPRCSPGAVLHAPACPMGTRCGAGGGTAAAPTIFLAAETYAVSVIFFPLFDTLILLAEWSPLSLSTEKEATHPINRPSSGSVIFQPRGVIHFLAEQQPSLAVCRWGGGTGSPRPSAFWHTQGCLTHTSSANTFQPRLPAHGEQHPAARPHG